MNRTHNRVTRLFAMFALALALRVPASALPPSSSCELPSAPTERPSPSGSCCCSGDAGGCGAMPAREAGSAASSCGCEIAAPSAPSTGVIPTAVEPPAPRVERLALQDANCGVSLASIATHEVYLDIGAAPPGSARPLYAILSLLLI